SALPPAAIRGRQMLRAPVRWLPRYPLGVLLDTAERASHHLEQAAVQLDIRRFENDVEATLFDVLGARICIRSGQHAVTLLLVEDPLRFRRRPERGVELRRGGMRSAFEWHGNNRLRRDRPDAGPVHRRTGVLEERNAGRIGAKRHRPLTACEALGG